ncbi:putative DNA helicase ino80, partial [Linderina pennispora]
MRSDYDSGRSPDVPLAKRQSTWHAKQQGPIVVSDDDATPALPPASAGKAGDPMAAFSDEDSQPLANRTASSLTLDQPKPPPAKRRRQSRAQGTRRRTSTSAGTAAQSNNATGDDSTANSTKGSSRRKTGRKGRGSKKVELSSQFVYDEDADEDDPSVLEQSASAFDGNGYTHRSTGDQEVAVPNADEGDGAAAVTTTTAIHRSLENGDSSVDQHVQEYIQHVRQRNSRAIEKYEEKSRQKYERMQEHIMRKYGPYLQRYTEHMEGTRNTQDESYHQPSGLPREDEYDLMDDVHEQMPGSRKRKSGPHHRRNASQSTRRGQNGYRGESGEFDSPFAVSQLGSMQPPAMGYFTPSRPASPGMVDDGHDAQYDYGYRRNDSPLSDMRGIEPHMTEEEIAQMRREDEAQRESDGRKSMWAHIAVDYIPRAYRHMQANAVLRNGNLLKISQLAQREIRRIYGPPSTRVIQLNPHQPTYIQRPPKELLTRARRSMREMLMFWKRHEKEEREMRKRAEKEAIDRQRQEEEAREARRQARKLNFLITQTELYSHFIGDKISGGSKGSTGKADGPSGASTAFGELDFDEADDASIQAHAKLSAQNALAQQQEKTREFDAQRKEQLAEQQGEAADGNVASALDAMDFQQPETLSGTEVAQPHMLMCQLKEYQLKGLNWLANLYEQGINGILADEMGLGKTVQSISLLAYLAETHNIWGPFMVVAPASTLHNWQQELTRFVPEFKVLPYWGSQKDRKVLRKSLYNPQNLSRKDSAFHVLVTSYQLVVSDES